MSNCRQQARKARLDAAATAPCIGGPPAAMMMPTEAGRQAYPGVSVCVCVCVTRSYTGS